jgi:hypothetical protein
VVVGAGTDQRSLDELVGGSRDIDATVRARSDHLVAREAPPALKTIA